MRIIISLLLCFCSCALIALEKEEVQARELAQRLQRHVLMICAVEPARNHHNIESLNMVRDYIVASFVKAELAVKLQEYQVDGKTYANVVGRLDLGREKTIILGAHYDVCHDQQGADDNASAVAGLLELAQILSKQKEKLRCNIEFVAYTLEEPPYFRTQFMGSYVHAQSLQKRIEAKITIVEYMMCLEMIGYFTDAEKSQEYPSPLMNFIYPSVGNFIAVVGNSDSKKIVEAVALQIDKRGEIPCESLVAPADLPGVDFSDHFNYWDIGIPAVMITDTAFYRNKNYHKETDTPDTLNYEKMAAVVLGLVNSFHK